MPMPKNDGDADDKPDPMKPVNDMVDAVTNAPANAVKELKKVPGKAVRKARDLVGLKKGGVVDHPEYKGDKKDNPKAPNTPPPFKAGGSSSDKLARGYAKMHGGK